ncbi:MAG TPA: 30S ribosome-binding factor RbfA [Actinomycetota bacterium]
MSPRDFPRAARVAHAIKQVVADEVERLRDPGLGFVTITEVTLTRDLRQAKAYYTVLGEDVEQAASRDALARATQHVRAAVAHRVRLKFAPTLEFVQDRTSERASRVDEIIASLHEREQG